jgi:ABC-type transport system involved in multi-copper enzyme maturation permease subunit
MTGQTIALFRYLWLGIMNRRLFLLLAVLVLAAVLCGSFIGELAIINGAAIVGAFIADFLRYSLALLALLMVASAVAEDFESGQFERLLTMPLARWQYIAAQTLVIACLCLLLVLPVFLLVSVYSGPAIGFYWAASLWLELLLISLLGLLAILSLEKITQAVFFSLAIYLLAKLSGLIMLMLAESVRLSEGSAASRAVEFIFSAILYLLPDNGSFADSDVFFNGVDLLPVLGEQLFSVVIYVAFLLAACLVDFYRKEFNF